MAEERKELQPQTAPATSARQQQVARPVVIDAEYSEVKTEATATQGEEAGSGFMDWVRDNHAEQPKLGAEFRAWLREGAKDLWNAIVPAFPDSQRLGDEQGTPLNPTPQNVTADLGNFHGYRQDRDVAEDASHRAQFQNQNRDQDLSR